MKKLFSILFLFGSISAYASEYTEKTGYVKNVFVDYSVIKVQVCDDANNCEKYYYEPDSEIKKHFMPILLSANTLNKKVWAFGKTSPNASWPYNNYHRLSSLDLIAEDK